MDSSKKERTLNLARNAEEKVFLARCIDQIQVVKKRGSVVLTNFLNPGELGLLKDVCRGYGGLKVLAWGAEVSEGDTIACRGYGRFRLSEGTGHTRKGRSRLMLQFPT